ncbi:hypothetical protein LLT3_09355 [Lactococcus cremoris subsp. cremoris TIFN3]|uniref:Uncharacterized protein n=1 Tax=Lactococcus cremoris subsp. cremoris TIFN3 TaxID=1234873 RepID=T0WU87_LACLC|nr:hypothetical protein LLT3_09355 [Lactococcus cremoris subsp. cremoris TIFN3]
MVAGIKATTEFFAPEIGIVPEIRFPPLITIFSYYFKITFHIFIVLKKLFFYEPLSILTFYSSFS